MRYLLLTILFLIATIVGAAPFIVDNNLSHPAHYRTIQAANDGCDAGDTIYVMGSSITYPKADITKQLVIIGPGYFLNENPPIQSNRYPATVDTIVIHRGDMEFTRLYGLYFTGPLWITSNYTYVNHCGFNTSGDALTIYHNSGNVHVQSCYIRSNGGRAVYLQDATNNSYIENCYLGGPGGSLYGVDDNNSGVQILNSVLEGNLTVNHVNVTNSILVSGSCTASNSTIRYNLCSSTQFPATNNLLNVNMDSVFVGGTSTDGRWQLSANSRAHGAGSGGADCGMFGGTTVYSLSGECPFAAIYDLIIKSQASTQGNIQIQLKARFRMTD